MNFMADWYPRENRFEPEDASCRPVSAAHPAGTVSP